MTAAETTADQGSSADADTQPGKSESSSQRHTPGPWMALNMVHAERGDQMTPEEVGEYVAGCVRLGSPDRFLFVTNEPGAPDICHIGNGPSGPANARLIAAAPDLLEALEEFSREYDGFQDGDGDPCPTLAKARAAIEKATGQAVSQ